jgi:hypothetical protein
MRCEAAFLTAFLAIPATALAQEEITTPSLPSNPQSPTDFQGTAQQMGDFQASSQAISGDASGSGGASAAGSPRGYSGGDLVIGDGSADKYTTREPDYLPEFHVVREGDTLWSVCDYYYRDPWRWPELWGHNKSITNPHWIYPGDRLKLVGGQPPPPGAKPETLIRLGNERRPSSDITLRQNAFIDPQQLEAAGKVAGSRVEHAMLTIGDEIYVAGGEGFKPEVGKVYSIYDVRRQLEHDGKQLGHIVDILGTARVKRKNDNGIATAVILSAVDAIPRGSRVGPLRRTYKRLAVSPARKNIEGKVIDYMVPSTVYAGPEDIVFVSRGRDDGVELGNRFLVTRRGDGHRRIYHDLEQKDERFPAETIAEIAVLDLRAHASVGLVTRAIKEIRKGDKVQMRRGY